MRDKYLIERDPDPESLRGTVDVARNSIRCAERYSLRGTRFVARNVIGFVAENARGNHVHVHAYNYIWLVYTYSS